MQTGLPAKQNADPASAVRTSVTDLAAEEQVKKPGRFTSKQLFICLLLAASLPVCSHAADNDFFELDLSTLMQIQLTTAGRK